jgi:ubiquinone/menaquinone biosynthesis C-methylase UbiE
MGESLATGFVGLDRVADPAVFVSCLRYLGDCPGMRAIKDESVKRLGLFPGARALEVGCGLGVEAAAMARLVGAGGLTTALDASQSMLGRLAGAAQDAAGPCPLPVAGDAVRLPFADAAFDVCRVERTLQHVPSPGAALAEMARVVRPRGRVLAVEPDWGTFVVDSDLRETSRLLAAFWCDGFQSGWIGRQLPRLMAAAGLDDIAICPRSLVLTTLEAAEAVYNLFATVDRAVADGTLSLEAAGTFKAEQRCRDAAGRFFASLTFFMVSGRKSGEDGGLGG